MAEINWGLLVSQNRAKAINVSWNEKELEAIYGLGIPAEQVRKGILTLEEFKSESEDTEPHNDKMIRSMSKDELKTLATELGLVVPESAKRLEIISLIHKSKLPADSE
jgi:hypothetical protein